MSCKINNSQNMAVNGPLVGYCKLTAVLRWRRWLTTRLLGNSWGILCIAAVASYTLCQTNCCTNLTQPTEMIENACLRCNIALSTSDAPIFVCASGRTPTFKWTIDNLGYLVDDRVHFYLNFHTNLERNVF